jgi:hypothetical protein
VCFSPLCLVCWCAIAFHLFASTSSALASGHAHAHAASLFSCEGVVHKLTASELLSDTMCLLALGLVEPG